MTIRRTATVLTALVGGLLAARAALCADITVDRPGGNENLVAVSIRGEITRGDDRSFTRLVSRARQVWVRIESGGGDVDTALAIGSAVRAREGIVLSGGC